MDEPLRTRRARAALATALALSLGLVGSTTAQDGGNAEITDAEMEAAAGVLLGDDQGMAEPRPEPMAEPRPASAYNWGDPVEGESSSAAPMTASPAPPAPSDPRAQEGPATMPAMEADTGEYLVDTSSDHLQQRAARYRYGLVGRAAHDDQVEGFGAGIFFQGPNWFRDVDTINDPDPKLNGFWRLTLTSHDLDLRNPGAGAAALQGEEALLLTVGVGGEYFFKRQFRQRHDEQGRPMWDRWGDPVLVRQNSPYLSLTLESVHPIETRGTTPSTQDSGGAFNNTTGGLSLGFGYQIKSRMRFGVEHSFVGGPLSTSQFYLGSSF